jgi:O-antigen/teichoic acid export membrane protein
VVAAVPGHCGALARLIAARRGVRRAALVEPHPAAALLAAPLCALLRLGAETLKAMDAPAPAVLVESLVIPLLLLAAAAFCWASREPLTTAALLAAGLAGYLAAPALLGWMILRRVGRMRGNVQAAEPAAAAGGDLNTLWGSSLLNAAFLQLPFVVLPLFASTAEIGVYAVANKLMGIVTTLLLLLAAVFGPAFARAAVGAHRELPRLLRRSSGWPAPCSCRWRRCCCSLARCWRGCSMCLGRTWPWCCAFSPAASW